MLKFYVYSKKALRAGEFKSRSADFVALVTAEVGGWSQGWKCKFGPDGIAHPAVNGYKTPVPFDEVLARLGTDDIEGNAGAVPTMDFVPDSYYRQVSLEELRAMGETSAFVGARDTSLKNVFINVSDETYIRLEAEAKAEGYLSIGGYLMAKALGEPAHISIAKEIVFSRMKLLIPGTVFRSTELMTAVEQENVDVRQVGRAVALIVAHSTDPVVADTVTKLPARSQTGQGSYKRVAAKGQEQQTDGEGDDNALTGMDEIDESLDDNTPGAGSGSPDDGVFDPPVAQAVPEEDPRDRKARLKHNVAYWDSVRAAQGKN